MPETHTMTRPPKQTSRVSQQRLKKRATIGQVFLASLDYRHEDVCGSVAIVAGAERKPCAFEYQMIGARDESHDRLTSKMPMPRLGDDDRIDVRRALGQDTRRLFGVEQHACHQRHVEFA